MRSERLTKTPLQSPTALHQSSPPDIAGYRSEGPRRQCAHQPLRPQPRPGCTTLPPRPRPSTHTPKRPLADLPLLDDGTDRHAQVRESVGILGVGKPFDLGRVRLFGLGVVRFGGHVESGEKMSRRVKKRWYQKLIGKRFADLHRLTIIMTTNTHSLYEKDISRTLAISGS